MSKPNLAELKKQLTPLQYHVTQEKGTEPAFANEYDQLFEPGMYACRICGAPLFLSDNKYDSGCGWPAFDQPVKTKAVQTKIDNSLGLVRTEVACANCGSHLGHIFNDGPKTTTGQRYCINSAALKFKKID